jgi:hypothetical protein
MWEKLLLTYVSHVTTVRASSMKKDVLEPTMSQINSYSRIWFVGCYPHLWFHRRCSKWQWCHDSHNETCQHNYSMHDVAQAFKLTWLCCSHTLLNYLSLAGVFCYDYVSSYAQMKNMQKLPPQSAFFSKLTNTAISDSDYKHAQTVFSTFRCSNLLDYCELYCCKLNSSVEFSK